MPAATRYVQTLKVPSVQACAQPARGIPRPISLSKAVLVEFITGADLESYARYFRYIRHNRILDIKIRLLGGAQTPSTGI